MDRQEWGVRLHQEPKRGDIFIADLFGDYGTRPVLVVQNNKGNQHSNTVIVVPITSRKPKDIPTHVWIPSSSGMKRPGTAKCECIYTIPQYDLRKYIGTIRGTPTEKDVNRALKISLAIKR